MKPNETAQIEFIKDLLRQGKERKDILQPFTKRYKTSVKTFDTRLKHATKAIQGELELIKKESEKGVAKQIAELESKIMTVVERKLWLSKMISGEIKAKKPFVIAGKIMEYPEEPNHGDRVKALAELNKMDGSYEPTKTDITSNGKGIKSIIVERVRHNPDK